jgi:putative ABC transport system permease protein
LAAKLLSTKMEKFVRRRKPVQILWQDFRYAMRQLRKSPGFTIVAVLTLGLGIGANTAIFSVINAVLLQPLPYPDPARLVQVSQAQGQTTGVPVSLTKFDQLRGQSKTLEDAAAYFPNTFSLVMGREPEALPGARVTLDFFRLLGVTPVLGRTFLPEEEQPGGRDVALVSDGFWHSHFGGDEALVGKTLTVDGKNFTVIGILPKNFSFPLQVPEPEIWMPRVDDIPFLTQVQVHSGASYLGVIARLRPGAALSSALAELKTINAGYRAQYGSYADAMKYELAVDSLQDSLVGTLRPSLLVLLIAVGFVLLIGCANVANLLLARATAREREIAVRKALGASRLRLVRQLLSESVLLSLAGGIAGVIVCAALMPTLRAISPGTVPRLTETRIDAEVLLFSFLLCLATGIIFGLVPSLQIVRRELQSSLKEGGRGSSESGSRGRLRSSLVVAEVAVALVLMTGAGLLIESFAHLMRVDPGFTSQGVMTFPLSLPPSRYAQPAQQVEFSRLLLEKINTIPQVQAAGLTNYLPLSDGSRFVFFCAEGTPCHGIGKDPIIALRQVSPGYFDAIRTPLLRGRVFTESDTAAAAPVAVVNQTTASRYWPGQDPIGKRIANSRDMIQREVIGVVGDVKFNSLNAASVEEMYFPIAQYPWPAGTLVVRSNSDPKPLVAAVRQKIAELDPYLPVSGILSMNEVVSASVAQPRIVMQFVGLFAGFALLLSAIGIYGVMAYSVTQRSRELGVRMALGARTSDILRLVVGHGMRLTLAGVGFGIAVSLLLTHLLSSLLFGIHGIDPFVFSAAALVLVGSALLACYLPARRAAQVDPLVVLRSE